jgi:hypothetical protein
MTDKSFPESLEDLLALTADPNMAQLRKVVIELLAEHADLNQRVANATHLLRTRRNAPMQLENALAGPMPEDRTGELLSSMTAQQVDLQAEVGRWSARALSAEGVLAEFIALEDMPHGEAYCAKRSAALSSANHILHQAESELGEITPTAAHPGAVEFDNEVFTIDDEQAEAVQRYLNQEKSKIETTRQLVFPSHAA